MINKLSSLNMKSSLSHHLLGCASGLPGERMYTTISRDFYHRQAGLSSTVQHSALGKMVTIRCGDIGYSQFGKPRISPAPPRHSARSFPWTAAHGHVLGFG